MNSRSLRTSCLVIIAAALCGATLVRTIDASQTPTRIKLATLAPKGTSLHQVLLTMGEKWRAASSGAVTLTVTFVALSNLPDILLLNGWEVKFE